MRFSNPHSAINLSLSLFETRVLFVDHIQPAFSAYNLAIKAAIFNRCSYFHSLVFICWRLLACLLFVSENDPSSRQIIWAHLHSHLITRQYPDIVHPHFSRDGSKDLMPIFKFYFKHSIRQSFRDCSILFNKCLFRHTFWVRKDMGMT
jgi:hypothetical protein